MDFRYCSEDELMEQLKTTQGSAMKTSVCLVLLCGGSGTRLWPLSRALHPKPFVRINNTHSLLQQTFLRGMHVADPDHVVVVTGKNFLFKTEDDLKTVNANNTPITFITEPFGRNTAPAVAAAALHLRSLYGPDLVLLVLPADHLIQNEPCFSISVKQAIQLAQSHQLVTFGIQPTRADTQYGYLETEGNRVLNFIEKPTFQKAQDYLKTGRFLWNSGMFCFTTGTLLDQMKKHCPFLLAQTALSLETAQTTQKKLHACIELDEQQFSQVPDLSLDYALMEKTHQAAVVPCAVGWSDVGSWATFGDLIPADSEGNHIQGDVLVENCSGCTLSSQSRLIGALGLHDVVVVETEDAVLVADKKQTHAVKNLYAQLKKNNHQSHKQHVSVHRPWGTYTVLGEGANFKIKRISVDPGARLSLQMHQHRSEHWVVVQGHAHVVNGDQEFVLQTNESTFVPAGQKHRLSNLSQEPCILIEVQSGIYVAEDDIMRFEDLYGRLTETIE